MDISAICRAAVRAGASDIHIKVGLPPLFRIDGDIQPVPKAPRVTQEVAGQLAWSVMTPHQRERFKATWDVDLSYAVPEVGRFRVNVFRQRGLVGMVLRAIPNQVQRIEQLHLPAVLKRIALKHRGLVLVTGITGSGKSTTLAAMVEEINHARPCHVLTIEDPIEFVFRDRKAIINQREVGQDSQSFPRALRAALRQDPDVILVGELRDRETIEIALTAAETGHLVMGTLHTINAPEAINRIVDVFEPHHQPQIRHQLSGVLVAIVSQRLVKARRGGRIPAVEVMVNRGAVAECIPDAARIKEIPDLLARNTSQYGTQTFDQSLFWSLQDGLIDRETALLHANNPDDLALRLSGIASEEWTRPDPDRLQV